MQDSEAFSGRLFDVAVIGGGVAGLTAAVVLARARRSVLVIDSGSPRNAPASGVHGLLSLDGVSPAELLRGGRREFDGYGGVTLHAEARSARRVDGGFEVGTDGGDVVRSRRLLVTTGLVDELPDVRGLQPRWGRDVLHCPYCHGWEIRDQPVGVLGSSPKSIQQAMLFRQWTSDLTFLPHTAPTPTDEEFERLAARGIRVEPGTAVEVEVTDDQLSGVRLDSGRVLPLRTLVVTPRFAARSQILSGLGVEPTGHSQGVGESVAGDESGLTAAAGVWVAGNVTDVGAHVVTAAASGETAATAINSDLIAEETEQAVAAYRSALAERTS
jgi:thioredoxin reductase